MHCQVEINGGALMMTDMRAPDDAGEAPQGFHLQLVVDDGDLWWSRAVEAGCTVVVPFEKMFWGDRWGLLADPFGLTCGGRRAGLDRQRRIPVTSVIDAPGPAGATSVLAGCCGRRARRSGAAGPSRSS